MNTPVEQSMGKLSLFLGGLFVSSTGLKSGLTVICGLLGLMLRCGTSGDPGCESAEVGSGKDMDLFCGVAGRPTAW